MVVSSRLMKFRTLTAVCLATVIILGTAIAALPQRVYRAASDFWGSRYQVSPAASAANTVPLPPQKDHDAAAQLRHWNAIAINASGLDHTPVAPGEHRVFGEQVGPVRAARAIAIVHIAMFEAVNAIDRSCKSYVGITPAQPVSSMNCAIAQAAHDTLCAVFPSQTPSFDQLLADELALGPNGRPKVNGIMLGQHCASKIVALRTNDGSAYTEPKIDIDFIPSNAPGIWRQDPISQHPLALG